MAIYDTAISELTRLFPKTEKVVQHQFIRVSGFWTPYPIATLPEQGTEILVRLQIESRAMQSNICIVTTVEKR